jgi:hypothetical protein
MKRDPAQAGDYFGVQNLPFASSEIRGFNGLGKGISGTAKNAVGEGGAMAGFDPCCMVYSGPVQASVAGGTIALAAPALGAANGTFIRNKDDCVTFGQATAGGFLVSDQFGGCDMTILRAPDGAYWGAHVYSSASCRAAVAAPPDGWSVIGTWSSNGYAAQHPDCGALFVFAFFEGGKVVIVTVGGGGYPIAVRHVGIAAMFDLP